MTGFGRLLARGVNLTAVVALIAVCLMMVQVSLDVAGKFLLNRPVPATITLVSNYYMLAIAFLPLALAETRNGHVSVEVLTELFPLRAQTHLYAGSYLLSAAVYGMLTVRTWQEALRAHATGTFITEQGVKLIIWPANYLLPIGCGLMTLVVLYRFLIYLTGAKSGLGAQPLVEHTAESDATSGSTGA